MDAWSLARANEDTLTFSTILTAGKLKHPDAASASRLDEIASWCSATGVTKIYVESYRNGYTAPRETVLHVSEGLRRRGLRVAGGVTTTKMGKASDHWDVVCCFSDPPTCESLQRAFEHAASVSDEIMVDDFFFTECECERCTQARGERTWSQFRREMMLRLTRERVLGPARGVNPNVRIILKYPQWYENLHVRGYDIVAQTEAFDRTWVGTETRDPDRSPDQLPLVMQYQAYFNMRWHTAVEGAKCGGGWFDTYSTGPETYVEQAIQTILGGSREALLFSYGSLQQGTGPGNVEAFRRQLPGLFELARLVQNREPSGLCAPKPPSSDPGEESYVFDYVGMLGVPLVPATELDVDAPGAMVSHHAIADAGLRAKLGAMIDAGKPVLLTDGARSGLGDMSLDAANVIDLPVAGGPRSLLDLPVERLADIRSAMLAPLGIGLEAPARVALYPFGRDMLVVENFNPGGVSARLTLAGSDWRVALTIPDSAPPKPVWSDGAWALDLPPRTVLLLQRED
jgi:hypothetical protein